MNVRPTPTANTCCHPEVLRRIWPRCKSGAATSLSALLCLMLVGATTTQPADRPTVLIVLGAEGTPDYGAQFEQWADRWKRAATRASARVILIGSASANAPASTSPSSADKQQLQSRLATEAAQSTGPLWLILIGHGTYDGREAKFNLRGDDLSAAELSQWLKPLQRPLAVAACFSASAPFLNALSGDNRIILTATQSGREIQFSRFGDFLSTAITDPAADLDKDSQTSLLEAWLAASHRVAEFYRQESRLATEHALLDDNADALGTPATWFQGVRATKAARDGATLDGARAHQWHLVRSPAEQQMSPDQRARRDALELKIESLRARKSTLPEDQYYAQLERLLLELARLYQ